MAARARLNVVRLYAHTTDPDHPFQVRRRWAQPWVAFASAPCHPQWACRCSWCGRSSLNKDTCLSLGQTWSAAGC